MKHPSQIRETASATILVLHQPPAEYLQNMELQDAHVLQAHLAMLILNALLRSVLLVLVEKVQCAASL